MEQVTFPVRVMKALGVEVLVVSNACGALNPDIQAGDLMIITDHINLLGANPLIGKNEIELGPRFPDMSNCYDKDLIVKGLNVAQNESIDVKTGVYVAVTGPNLETSAEYRFLRIIGGDVVGMSTIPEVIVAAHCGLPVFALSVITDEGYHVPLESVSIEKVIEVASKTEPKMTKLIAKFVEGL
jgi:purine-nucleoside phosphorylase